MENWIGVYYIGNGVWIVWVMEGLEDFIFFLILFVGCDLEKIM